MTNLGSIAEIRMGATLRGRDATRPVPNGRFQLIRIGDISQDGNLLTKNLNSIAPNESVSQGLLLRSGDVLFPNRGNRTTALVYRLEQTNIIVGAQFFILRPDISQVLPEYLGWFLRTEAAAKYFDGRRRGTTVQIIQRRDLVELEMPLPSLDVQKRIVELAELAITERNLTEKLAGRKWKLVNDQILQAARNLSSEKNL
jgi:restriction endonuclease S subunit